ncbi:MAG: carbohydrate-binding family 9-like protein [Planctomycetaceae bacterium]|nr:carbohydrate-binding family 9-like protein [Planctomycetaceae bacterium]
MGRIVTCVTVSNMMSLPVLRHFALNRRFVRFICSTLLAAPMACAPGNTADVDSRGVSQPTVAVMHEPLVYECHRAAVEPKFDGELEVGPWAAADWSRDFRDIEGDSRPRPWARTRLKMLWDSTHLYVGCEMEEPDLWATYDRRDMIVFHEHDFEVFIDPDGDGDEYYEIEINVIGTIFDLFLQRPYRLGGPAEHGWDSDGLRWAIHADGTINQPGDRDSGWTVELAIPFADLRPPTTREDGSKWTLPPIAEHRRRVVPEAGDAWRINFSRVEWDLEVVDGAYRKVEGRPERNWTWTPQWEINMHVPSRWGFVRFLD